MTSSPHVPFNHVICQYDGNKLIFGYYFLTEAYPQSDTEIRFMAVDKSGLYPPIHVSIDWAINSQGKLRYRLHINLMLISDSMSIDDVMGSIEQGYSYLSCRGFCLMPALKQTVGVGVHP